jgi:hypothetical protein
MEQELHHPQAFGHAQAIPFPQVERSTPYSETPMLQQ